MPIYYQDEAIRIHKTSCGPYDNNSYLIVDLATEEGIVIDAPMESENLLAELGGVRVIALVISHTHRDHILGFDVMTKALNAPVGCHSEDAHLLPRPADFFLEDGQTLQFGRQKAKFLFTPGHTPGGTCTLVGRHLFPGDVLFPGGPGRTTSPENLQKLITNIKEKIYTLPDDVEVYPGHGTNTSLNKSKDEFMVFAGKPHSYDLYGDVLWLTS